MTIGDENPKIHTVAGGQLIENIHHGEDYLHHNHSQRRRPPACHETPVRHHEEFPIGSQGLSLPSLTQQQEKRSKRDVWEETEHRGCS